MRSAYCREGTLGRPAQLPTSTSCHKGKDRTASARLVVAVGLVALAVASLVIVATHMPQPLHTIVYRFSLGKSDLVRHWAAAATVLLMLFAVGLAVRTILWEGGEERSR